MKAHEAWPEIFENSTFITIPPSRPVPLIIPQRNLRAEGLMADWRYMEADTEKLDSLKSSLERINFDERIRQAYDSKCFETIVHAEVLLHSWLKSQEGGFRTVKFFNNWAYIGVSKPVCKLCDYSLKQYSNEIEVRESHGNLFLSWRFPSGPSSEDTENLQKRKEFERRVVLMLRDEAFDVISGKFKPRSKRWDTMTNSEGTALLEHWTCSERSTKSGDILSDLDNLSIHGIPDTGDSC